MDAIPYFSLFIGLFFLYQGIAANWKSLIFSRSFSIILGVFFLATGIFISME